MLPQRIGLVGACGPVGRRLVAALAEVNYAGTVVAVDTAAPQDPPVFVEAHSVTDPREAAPLVGDCDAVVHLGIGSTADDDPGLRGGAAPDSVAVAAALLETTGRPGDEGSPTPRLVLLSSARVYGAYPNNPVPLSEEAILRPNEAAGAAGRLAEIERRVAEVAESVSPVRATVLRTATVLGAGVDPFAAAALLEAETVASSGERPVVQYVHTEDVAAALVHMLEFDLDGVFNLAPPGWLTAEEVDAISRRRPPILRLGVDEYRRWVAMRHRYGRSLRREEQIPYHCYPWVVSTAKLTATGFRTKRSNAEALRAGLDQAEAWESKRSAAGRRVAKVAVAAAVATAAMWVRSRSR